MLCALNVKASSADTAQFDNRFYLYASNLCAVNSCTNNVLNKNTLILSGSYGTKISIHTNTYLSGDIIVNKVISFDIYD